jgi:hypothetical protein
MSQIGLDEVFIEAVRTAQAHKQKLASGDKKGKCVVS